MLRLASHLMDHYQSAAQQRTSLLLNHLVKHRRERQVFENLYFVLIGLIHKGLGSGSVICWYEHGICGADQTAFKL